MVVDHAVYVAATVRLMQLKYGYDFQRIPINRGDGMPLLNVSQGNWLHTRKLLYHAYLRVSIEFVTRLTSLFLPLLHPSILV
jgi:hypothetical protein